MIQKITILLFILTIGCDMGTPLPPNPPGVPCLFCFGVGKTFGVAPTPKYVTITLTGLNPGEFFDPTDGATLLTPRLLIQTIDPCAYNIDDGVFAWDLIWTNTVTALIVQDIATGFRAFETVIGDVCLISIENQLEVPGGNYAFDGDATVVFGGGP